jgi:hypothetical protein
MPGPEARNLVDARRYAQVHFPGRHAVRPANALFDAMRAAPVPGFIERCQPVLRLLLRRRSATSVPDTHTATHAVPARKPATTSLT